MHVKYFRQQRPGPEAAIENAVANRIGDMFGHDAGPTWAAASLPVGAGLPDLLIVSCHPKVFALSKIEVSPTDILAYLKAVSRASVETITDRVRQSRARVERCLDELLGAEVVSSDDRGFFLSPLWRDILPEVVTIEVKVSDWRRAFSQASRNEIFAHRSFVALPLRLAERLHSEPELTPPGIGILGVSDVGEVSVLRRAERKPPRVWSYYYRIASLAAEHLSEDPCPSSFP